MSLKNIYQPNFIWCLNKYGHYITNYGYYIWLLLDKGLRYVIIWNTSISVIVLVKYVQYGLGFLSSYLL